MQHDRGNIEFGQSCTGIMEIGTGLLSYWMCVHVGYCDYLFSQMALDSLKRRRKCIRILCEKEVFKHLLEERRKEK